VSFCEGQKNRTNPRFFEVEPRGFEPPPSAVQELASIFKPVLLQATMGWPAECLEGW
jgi:hypothetical protein